MRKVTLNDVTMPSVNKSASAIQVLARALKMKVLMSSITNESLSNSFLQNREDEPNEEEHLNALVSLSLNNFVGVYDSYYPEVRAEAGWN